MSNLGWIREANDLEALEWNFSATSHGKGAVDGVVGSVKRFVWRRVMADKVVVDSAQEFYQAAHLCPNISLLWVGTPEVDVNREYLTAHWEKIKPIGGMQKIYHVRVLTKDEVEVGKVTTMAGRAHNFRPTATRTTSADELVATL